MYHARVLLHLPPAALARACSLSPAQGAAFPIREQQRGPLLEAPHLIPQAKPSKTPGLKKSILWSTRLPFQSRTQRMPCTNRSSQNGDISSLVPKQDGGGHLRVSPPGGLHPGQHRAPSPQHHPDGSAPWGAGKGRRARPQMMAPANCPDGSSVPGNRVPVQGEGGGGEPGPSPGYGTWGG